MLRLNKKQISYFFGLAAEILVIIILTFKGYMILKWRFKTKVGEIDIIAKRGKQISFIEVKARANLCSPLDCLTYYQIIRIKKTAEFFMQYNKQWEHYVQNIELYIVTKKLSYKAYII